MMCPDCKKNGKSTRLRIVDSRPYGDNLRVRRYLCPQCGYTNNTYEKME